LSVKLERLRRDQTYDVGESSKAEGLMVDPWNLDSGKLEWNVGGFVLDRLLECRVDVDRGGCRLSNIRRDIHALRSRFVDGDIPWGLLTSERKVVSSLLGLKSSIECRFRSWSGRRSSWSRIGIPLTLSSLGWDSRCLKGGRHLAR
jgi:hypothetical protein